MKSTDKSEIYFHFFADKKENKIKVSYEDYIKHYRRNSTLDDRFNTIETTRIYSIDSSLLTRCEISTYLEEPMAHALMNIPDENYILCPLYSPRYKNISSDNYEWSDFQIGFTGTLKNKEIHKGVPDYFEGYKRELSEELGLLINSVSTIEEFKEISYTDEYRRPKNIEMYNIELSDLVLNTEQTRPSKSPDIKTLKIGGYIHSNLTNVLKYLNSDIILSSNEDNLVGIVAVKSEFAKEKYSSKFKIKYPKV